MIVMSDPKHKHPNTQTLTDPKLATKGLSGDLAPVSS